MPEEVLLLKYDGPKKLDTRRIRLVGSGRDASAMIAILERMAVEKFPPGTELVFIIEKEEASRISCGTAFVEGGGVFGHFPANRKLLLAEDGQQQLSQAITRSMALFEGNVIYSPDRRKDNLNAQVNPYVPAGRGAAALRQSARKRR